MSPLTPQLPGTAWFLNGLSILQQEMQQTQLQLSSGYRVNTAADSPAETPALVQLGSSLAAVQAYQQNLTNVQTEANTADQSLQQSITLIQRAVTLGTQGASSTATANTDQTLAVEAQGIQQQLIAIANTQVAGRYIFGGDQDQSPPYQYNGAAANGTGVSSLTNQTNSRTIVNTYGQTIYQSLTAQQIFGPVDNNGNPAPNNTFLALQSLIGDLQAGNQANIANDITALQQAGSYVGQQQAHYGQAENRLTSEQTQASSYVTLLQTQIAGIRDTNIAQAATELTQESTDQQAAMGAEAEVAHQRTLFDFIG
jgi:flagellar hook-associated protein 3 FlgL